MTETPLYTEAQMQARADAARREALEEAAKVCETYTYGSGRPVDNGEHFSALIRSLKENPNAG